MRFLTVNNYMLQYAQSVNKLNNMDNINIVLTIVGIILFAWDIWQLASSRKNMATLC